MQTYRLFDDDVPTTIDHYPSTYPSGRIGAVIFPGGAYATLSEHEGEGYARMLNTLGVEAFVVKYSTAPPSLPGAASRRQTSRTVRQKERRNFPR